MTTYPTGLVWSSSQQLWVIVSILRSCFPQILFLQHDSRWSQFTKKLLIKEATARALGSHLACSNPPFCPRNGWMLPRFALPQILHYCITANLALLHYCITANLALLQILQYCIIANLALLQILHYCITANLMQILALKHLIYPKRCMRPLELWNIFGEGKIGRNYIFLGFCQFPMFFQAREYFTPYSGDSRR